MEDNRRQWSSMEDHCDWRPRCVRFVQPTGRKDMKRRRQVVTTLALISLVAIVAAPIAPVHAQEVLKVGIIGQFSGPFAVTGEQYKQGLDSYLAQNGAVASGRKLELVYRDTGGPTRRRPTARPTNFSPGPTSRSSAVSPFLPAP